MKDSLVPGLERTERVLVDESRVITFLGDALRVYATPAMVSDVEYAALRLLEPHLEAGEGSVGVHIALDHLAPTPLGATVTVGVKLRSVEGRRVSFDAVVSDDVAMVGRGHHVRSVIDTARQVARLAGRSARR